VVWVVWEEREGGLEGGGFGGQGLGFCGRLMKLCRYFSFGKGSRAALEGARGSMPRHAIKV